MIQKGSVKSGRHDDEQRLVAVRRRQGVSAAAAAVIGAEVAAVVCGHGEGVKGEEFAWILWSSRKLMTQRWMTSPSGMTPPFLNYSYVKYPRSSLPM